MPTDAVLMPHIVVAGSVLAFLIVALWWIARPKRQAPAKPAEKALPRLTSRGPAVLRPVAPPRSPLPTPRAAPLPLPSRTPSEPEYVAYVPPPPPPPQIITNADLARVRASIGVTPAPEKPATSPGRVWKAPRVVESPKPLAPAVETLPPAPMPPPYDPHQRYVPPPYVPQKKITGKDIRRARAKMAKSVAATGSAAPQKSAVPTVPAPTPARSAQPTIRAPAPLLRASKPAGQHPFSGSKFQMSYGDAFGEVTEREIRLIRVEQGPEAIHLVAHCYQRREQRTFRADRIISITDIETGTFITDPEAFFSP